MLFTVPKAGDVLVRIACCANRSPVLVLRYQRSEWQCKCGKRGKVTHTITLGHGGEIPPPSQWQEVA